jgi:hypothetical protein
MKKYIKPASDIVLVATEEVMNGMSQVVIPINSDYDNLIYDGKDILGNENRVWDSLDDNL